MDYGTRFNITFCGLPAAGQQYDYHIGEEFFLFFNHPELKTGNLQATVTVNRMEKDFSLDIRIRGAVQVICDRCLGQYDLPIHVQERLIARHEADCSEADWHSDDILIMKNGEHSINLAQHFHDFISLAIPYRKIHPDDETGASTCDPEYLKYIMPQNAPPANGDPRWNDLKRLLDK